MLPDSVRRWRDRGRFETVLDHRVFVIDEGESDDVVLLLHGFPTSSHDFHAIWDRLGDRRRISLDLPGYGLSDKPVDYSYSLFEQAEVVMAILRARGIDEVHVVAHDMGTSVACELMARRERGALHGLSPRSLTLFNGSVHIDLAHLTPSQLLLRSRLKNVFVRLSHYLIFRSQLGRILSRPVDEAELRAMWAQLVHLDGRYRLPAIMSYIDERWRFRHRWIGALSRLDIPCLVAWGVEDPVAVLAIAEKLASEIPTARLERLEGIGHYPQLEDPERLASAIRAFLDEVDGG